MVSAPLRPGDVKADPGALEEVWSSMLSEFFRHGELAEECALHVTCPHCGLGDIDQEFVSAGFRHVTCCSCETVYVSPRLTDESIEQLYSDEYYDVLYASSEIPMFEQRTRLIGHGKFEQLMDLHAGARPGRVLDIGAGIGEVLEVFRAEGWSTHAIEMNAVAVEWLQGRSHDEVFHGRLEDFDAASQKFDIVMAWGVVEHVLDPDDFLGRAHGLLAPGGMFVSEVPHAQSLLVDVVRSTGLDPGRIVIGEQHIRLYSVGAYAELHERSGFVATHLQTNGLDVATICGRTDVNLPDELLAAMQRGIDDRMYGDLLRGFWRRSD